MMINPRRLLSVLLVDDDDTDARQLEQCLHERSAFEYDVTRVCSLEDGCRELRRRSFDLALLDLYLPDARGIEVIEAVRAINPVIPVVVLTDLDDENIALDALQHGAHEYLVKGEIGAAFLPKVIRFAVESARTMTELELAKTNLEQEVAKRTADLRDAHLRALQAERLAAIGQMATGLAHESRNALQRMQSSVNRLVRRSRDNPELLQIAEDVDLAVDDLRRLYNTIQQYAAPITFSRAEVNLKKVIEHTAEKVNAASELRTVLIELAEGTSEPVIEADVLRLEQVFRNMLENSLDASRTNVARVWTRFRALAGSDRAQLEVLYLDNGKGLTTNGQDIFQPFVTTKRSGTGLGMAIAKKIVDQHGGTIQLVDSLERCEVPEAVRAAYPGIAFKIVLPQRGSA